MPNRRKTYLYIGGVIAALALIEGAYEWQNHVQYIHQQEAKYQKLMATTGLDQRIAPNFTLRDQNGKIITLSSFRGKVVNLEFMDPECTDICPIVSQEVVGADKLLGPKQSNVVFLAVNVNQYHESQADVMTFSKEHGLSALPNWHFLTGSTQHLKAIWQAYGISVMPNPTGDVQHSSFMYFIDKQGREQYITNPDNVKSTIQEWADGIAYYVNRLA